MLVAAVGCNIARGFVDGVVFVLRSPVARGRQATIGRAARAAGSAEEGRRLIADEIGALSSSLGTAGLERVRQWIVEQPLPVARTTHPTARDLKGGLGVFLLVLASTFPVVLPFVFFADLRFAVRLSGVIAILMMFRRGYVPGRHAGLAPWHSGLVMVLMGVAVESVVIALGG